MSIFLRTQDVSSEIGKIIRDASSSVVLISPFVKINDTLFGYLNDASRKGIKITLVFGKEELKLDVKEQLAKLDNITVYYRKTLHAKCYFNEKQMVLTSMNLYDFSEVNNLEMGVLINAEDESSLFDEAKKEAESIVTNSEKVKIKDTPLEKFVKDAKPLSDGFKAIADSFGLTTNDGHCIECNSIKEFDVDKPLCKNCYPMWAKHKTNYAANYCHKCGKRVKTTMARPLCTSCYNK